MDKKSASCFFTGVLYLCLFCLVKECGTFPETYSLLYNGDNTLFSGTIQENLLLGNLDTGELQMSHALYGAAADFIYTLPLGLDTRCGEQGSGLSEGQAQRVAIARSLLRSGEILLLDEVTSALDTKTEKLLFMRLKYYAQRKTMVFITHREEITKGCDKLLLRSSSPAIGT